MRQLTAILWITGCAWAAGPALPLRTSGAQIVDANGSPVQLACVNWSGAEAKDYVVGGLDRRLITDISKTIANTGFNCVRLPWSNEMYEKNPPVPDRAVSANPRLQGMNAIDVFDATVQSLADAGLMIVLDNHMSDADWCCNNADGNTLWYNDAYPETNWIADWTGIVGRYAGQLAVIGADLRNEPRGRASWGSGDSATDWRAAAERCGNAVLDVNPNLLIFVEGTNYSGDLSKAGRFPVVLNIGQRLVYEIHDYGFWYNPRIRSAAELIAKTYNAWGYLVTGDDPQAVFIGEFGTCHNSAACVDQAGVDDLGPWFAALTQYIGKYHLSWSYWEFNGTQSTGAGRTFGAEEGYGIVDMRWTGVAFPPLLDTLRGTVNLDPLTYKVVNRNSALVLDSSGASLTQQPDSGIDAQRWQVLPAMSGLYQLTTARGQAAGVNGSSSHGHEIGLEGPDGNPGQLWALEAAGDSYLKLRNSLSNDLADVSGASKEPGVPVIQWPGNQGANQHWTFQPLVP